MARAIEQNQLSQEMQREISRKQQQIIQRYQKRLGAKAGQSSKKMLELQSFLESGKQVGSSQFLKWSPVVQEVVVQLNLSGIEIMRKHTKNPFKKAPSVSIFICFYFFCYYCFEGGVHIFYRFPRGMGRDERMCGVLFRVR